MESEGEDDKDGEVDETEYKPSGKTRAKVNPSQQIKRFSEAEKWSRIMIMIPKPNASKSLSVRGNLGLQR